MTLASLPLAHSWHICRAGKHNAACTQVGTCTRACVRVREMTNARRWKRTANATACWTVWVRARAHVACVRGVCVRVFREMERCVAADVCLCVRGDMRYITCEGADCACVRAEGRKGAREAEMCMPWALERCLLWVRKREIARARVSFTPWHKTHPAGCWFLEGDERPPSSTALEFPSKPTRFALHCTLFSHESHRTVPLHGPRASTALLPAAAAGLPGLEGSGPSPWPRCAEPDSCPASPPPRAAQECWKCTAQPPAPFHQTLDTGSGRLSATTLLSSPFNWSPSNFIPIQFQGLFPSPHPCSDFLFHLTININKRLPRKQRPCPFALRAGGCALCWHSLLLQSWCAELARTTWVSLKSKQSQAEELSADCTWSASCCLP